MKNIKNKREIINLSLIISVMLFSFTGIIISFTKVFMNIEGKDAGKIALMFFDKFLFLTVETNISLVVFSILYILKFFNKIIFKKQNIFEMILMNFLILIFVIYFGAALPLVNLKNMSAFTWFYQLSLHLFGLIGFSVYFFINLKDKKYFNLKNLIIYQILYLVSWLFIVEVIALIKYYVFYYTNWFINPWDYIPYEIIDPITNSWFGISNFITIPLFWFLSMLSISIIPIVILIKRKEEIKEIKEEK